jgi:hypothetical protein
MMPSLRDELLFGVSRMAFLEACGKWQVYACTLSRADLDAWFEASERTRNSRRKSVCR